MKANHRIYRNLHRGGYSVQSYIKGKGWRVTDYIEQDARLEGAYFKVYEAGRQRVLQSGEKNVHAYIMCHSYSKTEVNRTPVRVSYDPYTSNQFYTYVNADTEMRFLHKEDGGDRAVLHIVKGKVYIWSIHPAENRTDAPEARSAAKPARTLAQVNKAIQQAGMNDVYLCRGDGYFYVVSDDYETSLALAGLRSTSICVCYINHQTVKQWIEDVADIVYELSQNQND